MVRQLRLWSGLVLFAFVATHLLNHALGLISLDAMEAGRGLFLAVWRSLPGTLLLYGALILHLGLAFWAIFRRRSLRMPLWEALQLVLGLCIPPLLVIHVLGTRMAHELFGLEDSYVYELLIMFHLLPDIRTRQFILVFVAWLHGVLGLYFWLRLKTYYAGAAPYLFATALLLPVLASLGTLVQGREILRLASDPGWVEATMARLNFPVPEQVAVIYRTDQTILLTLAVLLVLALAGRQVRFWWARRRGLAVLTYPGPRRIEIVAGPSVLETSRTVGIPHASVCGGKGRCSTCRVRLGKGIDHLPPPDLHEAKVLARVGAPPNVRLACQIRPSRDLEVTPLLPASGGTRRLGPQPAYLQGEEREVAVLFADLRGFTALAEDKLPYDVVFVLNRYFATMGAEIEKAGGHIDKFIGDGIMALFGVRSDPDEACRQAVAAARAMAERLVEMNASLRDELKAPLRMGMGVHIGPVILGELGYGPAVSLTAVGDTVNTASRLESLTKDFKAQLILSEPVVRHAGLDLSAFPEQDIELRGRQERLAVRVIKNAQRLPATATVKS